MSDFTNPLDGKPLVKWKKKPPAPEKAPDALSSDERLRAIDDVISLRKRGYSKEQIVRGLLKAGRTTDVKEAWALIAAAEEAVK
jgi:hypothetical protein